MARAYSDDFSPEAIDPRITVHEAAQVVEIDFTGLYFHTSRDVNAFYDLLEERLSATGEPLWFFMVNTSDYRIDGDAWFAFTKRGRELNEAHSMQTVRVDTSPEAAKLKTANTFGSRTEALDHLAALPSGRRERVNHAPTYTKATFVRRFKFSPKSWVMEVDWSGVTFHHSRDVNDIFNWIEDAIRATRRKWFLLINYEDVRIEPKAWVQYSLRSDDLADRFILGAVRYGVSEDTEKDKRARLEAKGTRPNIRQSREEALLRLEELRAEAFPVR